MVEEIPAAVNPETPFEQLGLWLSRRIDGID
jgi:hypothetical protein